MYKSMKKLFLPLLIAGLFSGSSVAHAEDPYVSISGGLGLKNNLTVKMPQGQSFCH